MWSKQVLLNSAFLIVFLLLPVVFSSEENVNLTDERNCKEVQKLSPQVTYQVIIHGFMLWASMGFLTPVGILLIRTNLRLESGRKLKILYHLHVVTQVCSVVLVTIAAALSFKNFENAFNNSHQRMGLALYIAVWLQLLTGYFRPNRGTNERTGWFFVHWMFGTFVSLLGIISIYTGLHAYHRKTLRDATLWTGLFTVEMILVAFGYLVQDKWEYILNQGVVTRTPSMMPITNKQCIQYDGNCKQETQP